jgi:lipopolysaccharide transport system permease protein
LIRNAALPYFEDTPYPLAMDWRRYWDIIVYRTYAELKSEAQLSYMGYVWWVLEPLLNTVLFFVIMAAILGQSSKDIFSFLLVGSIIWQWLNASLLGAANSIVDAGGMLKQIYLPKAVLPLISIFTCTWKFMFIFLLLLICVWASGHPPTAAYACLPLLLLLEFLVIVAFTLPLAAIMPYFPDARVAVDALLRSMLLISGIFFPASQLPPAYRVYFHLNPMADLIEAFRTVLLDGGWPRWYLMEYVALLSLGGLAGAVWLYTWVDRSIVKAIHR